MKATRTLWGSIAMNMQTGALCLLLGSFGAMFSVPANADDIQDRAASVCRVVSTVQRDFQRAQKTPDMRQSGPGYKCAENYFGANTQCWFKVPAPNDRRQDWWILMRWELGDLDLALRQRDSFAASLKQCRFQLEDEIADGEDFEVFLRTASRSQRLFVESSTASRGMVLLKISGEPDE